MNAGVIEIIGWIIAGMVLMGLIVWFAMPSMMLIKHRSKLAYDDTVNALSEAVSKKQDWQVLTVNDYQKKTASFTALERVGSITICNPRYSAKILTEDKNRHVTAFMPLEFGVYEDKKGQVYVSQLNVGLLGKMFGGTISTVMGMAGKDLIEVASSVSVR